MVTTTLPKTHVTEHSVTVAAPPAVVFDLVADVERWPQMFGPTVHVELLDDQHEEQVMRIWALAQGRVRSWASRRTLDHARRTIGFRQVVSAPPVAAMGGQWCVQPAGAGGSRVVLRHDYQAVDDDPEAVALISKAVDRNSDAELAALKETAERSTGPDERQLSFHDSVRVNGSAEDVFAFLDRAERWSQLLPHVARVEMSEAEAGVQHLEMDTRGPDGSVHTTASVRVCFPERGSIVYKQIQLPPVMTVHTGRWTVVSDGEGVVATSYHHVMLSPEGVARALGADATLADARARVREALGTNSTTTLQHAKRFAETRGRG